MILDHVGSAPRSLEAVLAGAITTSQPTFVVGYSELDASGGVVTPAPSPGQLNSTTEVTILAAPAAGLQRVVDSLNIYNKDTVSATVTVQMNDNGTVRIIKKKTLAAGETLSWDRNRGWG